MSRYATTKQIKDSKLNRKAETTIITATPPSPSDIYIQVSTPERLDMLAQQFYGDATQWWIIAAANGLGKGTLIVPSNTNLRIPAKTQFLDQVIQTNRTR